MAKFTKEHAKEHLPDGSDAQHKMFVSAANKTADGGASDEDAIAAGKKAAANVKESAARTELQVMLAEVGKVLSSANEERIVKAKGHLEDVLGSLKTDKGTDPAADPIAEAARARSLQLMGLQESGSESADDAARGTWILGELYRLMGDEADEPDQLKQLQDAAGMVGDWIRAEAEEIGTDEDAEQVYSPYFGWEAKGVDQRHPSILPLQEAATTPIRPKVDGVLIQEAAVRRDGTVRVKIISEGWGTSGYYSQKLLKEKGPKVFTAGTQMYWDHPTRTEESDRPERSLRDLAAKLVTDAVYETHTAQEGGNGLYADAKVYEAFQPAVDELAGDIGVSIRALGQGHRGEAEGRQGVIVDDITEAASVDFVTVAGRGGEILPLFEAARARAREAHGNPSTPQEDHEVDLKEAEKLQASNARLQERLVLAEARDVIRDEVEKSAATLPQAVRARLVKTLTESKLPTTEKEGEQTLDRGKMVEAVAAAITAEQAYLAEIGVQEGKGRPRGLGGSGTDEPAEVDDDALAGSFRRLGMSESAAKFAVNLGRS